MARARNIKPGFFKNEDLAECSPWARLCFAGLWTLADREGRLEDRAKRIKGELFPFDSIEVEPLLVELQRWKFIDRYVAYDVAVIQILEFKKHQTPHFKEVPSELPPPQSPRLDPHSMNHEPKASPPLNDHETQDKPEASPSFDPHSKGGQSPLNPESGFLIPDSPSLIPDTGEEKTPRKRAATTPAPAIPCPEDVDPQVWADWQQLRKRKKAPVTETVMREARREAEKAAMPLERFLEIWCARGSQGLEAGWLRPSERADPTPPPEPEWRREQRERVQQAAPYAAARRDQPQPPEVHDALPTTTR